MTEAVVVIIRLIPLPQNPRAITSLMFGAIYMFAMDEVHQAERNVEMQRVLSCYGCRWVYPSLGVDPLGSADVPDPVPGIEKGRG